MKVLIAEDNDTNRKLLQAQLEAEGHSVVGATDGVEALKLLERERVDAIISDILMPNMDGYRFCHRVRKNERFSQLPFIFYTNTYLSPGDEKLALDLGADRFFRKPSAVGLILKALEEILASRRQARSPSGTLPEMEILQEYSKRLVDKLEERNAELVESEARFRAVADTATDAIVSANGDGNIIYFNKAAEQMFGYREQEALGRPLTSLMPSRSRDQHQEGVPRLLQTGETQTIGKTVELEGQRKDGTEFPIELSLATWRTTQGVFFTGIIRDITERKQREEQLRDSNRRLERALADLRETQQQIVQQERLRALGEMASGVAHDFNNALAKILGFNELLLTSPEKLSNTDTVRQYLQMTNTAAQDAANVVRRLREFYRKRRETETFEPVNLNQLVQQTVSLTEPKWKQQTQASGITVAVHTDLREVPEVGGSDADLREALTNLIFNAVDAMPEGGAITIRTAVEGKRVVMEVCDTGTGMTEEVRRRCLEPFFSTKGEHGTGLGLAIVYGIVRRHGGSIDIESEAGKGTTFIIRLPIYTGQHEAPSKPKTETVSRPLRVLVVDDDPLLRDIEAEYLTSDGHTVETAADGNEALQKLRWKQFDLVMADRAMPQMNGDQLAAAVKRLLPGLPVILVTGFGDMLKSGAEKTAGVDLIVPKPFTQANLREAVLRVTGPGTN